MSVRWDGRRGTRSNLVRFAVVGPEQSHPEFVGMKAVGRNLTIFVEINKMAQSKLLHIAQAFGAVRLFLGFAQGRGRSRLTKMVMMATTTNSSMSVNARLTGLRQGFDRQARSSIKVNPKDGRGRFVTGFPDKSAWDEVFLSFVRPL